MFNSLFHAQNRRSFRFVPPSESNLILWINADNVLTEDSGGLTYISEFINISDSPSKSANPTPLSSTVSEWAGLITSGTLFERYNNNKSMYFGGIDYFSKYRMSETWFSEFNIFIVCDNTSGSSLEIFDNSGSSDGSYTKFSANNARSVAGWGWGQFRSKTGGDQCCADDIKMTEDDVALYTFTDGTLYRNNAEISGYAERDGLDPFAIWNICSGYVGVISEILIYDINLSVEDRDVVSDYLMTKYGIS